jgi:uncharacterized protein YceH (UPF0502 family)
MDIILDDREIRILGCLIEKELTTPEYYPLSLNSLTNACNQKSNRNPVISYDEAVVEQGLDSLQSKGLARKTLTAGSRVDKYLHTILDRFDLSKPEMAVLCELMLRGPQTAGELRSRADRMSSFENLDKVEETLRGLMDHGPALIILLPREPGRKERRYAHLLSATSNTVSADADQPGAPSAPLIRTDERLRIMEEEVETGLRRVQITVLNSAGSRKVSARPARSEQIRTGLLTARKPLDSRYGLGADIEKADPIPRLQFIRQDTHNFTRDSHLSAAWYCKGAMNRGSFRQHSGRSEEEACSADILDHAGESFSPRLTFQPDLHRNPAGLAWSDIQQAMRLLQ